MTPCASCAREVEVPPMVTWDRNTAVVDGVEVVVELHVGITCPFCGNAAAFLSEPVDPPLPLEG